MFLLGLIILMLLIGLAMMITGIVMFIKLAMTIGMKIFFAVFSVFGFLLIGLDVLFVLVMAL